MNCQARPIVSAVIIDRVNALGPLIWSASHGANTHASTPMGTAAAAQTPAMPRALNCWMFTSGDGPARRVPVVLVVVMRMVIISVALPEEVPRRLLRPGGEWAQRFAVRDRATS